jgi:hypothetical protein
MARLAAGQHHHPAFQSMVVIGTLLAAAVLLFSLLRWRGRDLMDNGWLLRFSVITEPRLPSLRSNWVRRQPRWAGNRGWCGRSCALATPPARAAAFGGATSVCGYRHRYDGSAHPTLTMVNACLSICTDAYYGGDEGP